MGRLFTLLAWTLLAVGCVKVSIKDIEAGFDLADAAWFEDEQTLFFFYEVSAEQGISEQSIIEVTYRTDDDVVDWASADQLSLVHTHRAVDCGFLRLCGSLSLHVPIEPRDVGIRLRYHRDGALSLGTELVYNVVSSGPPHANRSFLVYGVFTADNRRIQWRGRHRFPTLRNEQVEALGLRRMFRISDQRYGTAEIASAANPYGYAAGCPGDFLETDLEVAQTNQRAVFNRKLLTLDASAESSVCARSEVWEPAAPFVSTALARKNPEVEQAFPLLRSPVKNATPIKFYLAPCNRTISAEHDAMQRQRLLFGPGPTYCTDQWMLPQFVPELVADLRDAIERTRPEGRDMVLVVGLHRDEALLADRLEEALEAVLPSERARSTPRVVGAFVFDSEIRDLEGPLSRLVLWCPASLPRGADNGLPAASQVSCGIVPDNVSLELGPFTLASLPILASRSRYLDFIEEFSEGQAGTVQTLTFLAPEFTPTTDNIELGGPVATFFNGERITSDPDDAFSLCDDGERQTFFVFRSAVTQMLDCASIGGDACVPGGILPIDALPQWHQMFQETSYELGIGWDFPWLLRMEYEVIGAASANAFGLSIPFGFGADTVDEFGSQVWTSSEFPLRNLLLHCKRFCDHPTFDSAGVYNVTQSFRDTYAAQCYLPLPPAVGTSSFPLDP